MVQHLTNFCNKIILTIPLAVMFAMSFGCASPQADNMKHHRTKHISDIIISEHSESLTVTIKGDQSLIYKADKQLSPIGIVLNFPDTTLDVPNRLYIPPESEIISSIEANQINEERTIKSRIFIALRKDNLYELIPDNTDLNIIFPKAIAFSNDTKLEQKISRKKFGLNQTAISLPVATRLISVTPTPLNNNFVVSIQADGAIKDYKYFNLDNPARIVFDMFNIKSPKKSEQIIAVESKWIKRVRYFGYQDKVRLVLDTHKEYLSKYSAHSTDTGLLINVGKTSAVPDNARQTFFNDNLRTQQTTLSWHKVAKATSYNVYLSSSPGFTKRNGIKISTKNNYLTIKGIRGTTIYFMVYPVRNLKESKQYIKYSVDIPE